MLNPNSECPAAEKELIKIYFKHPEGQKISKKFHVCKCLKQFNKFSNYFLFTMQDLYEYVGEKSGLKIDNMVKAFALYDALIGEKSANYSLPDWATSTILEQLKESKIRMNLLYKNSRKFQRLRTGLFFADLSNKIEKSIKSNDTIKKVYLYSTVN